VGRAAAEVVDDGYEAAVKHFGGKGEGVDAFAGEDSFS
jgi:hypothetical protein